MGTPEPGAPDTPRPEHLPEAPQAHRSHRLRTALLAVLLVCTALVGVGSVLLSSQLSHPTGVDALSGTRPQDVVTLYTPSGTETPTPAPVTTTPAPCTCVARSVSVPLPPASTPLSGQYIVVSISKQWLWAYQNGQVVFNTPVTTGRPELPTPTGYFSIQQKLYDIWFYSPWPPGSPYYYSPEHVDYAMLFRSGGYFLHNAPWRHCFGPGTNLPHTCPDGTQEVGSHGCVNLPTPAAGWLINWVRLGTTVRIEW